MFEVPSTHVYTSYTTETHIFVRISTISHFRVPAQIDKSAPSDLDHVDMIKTKAPSHMSSIYIPFVSLCGEEIEIFELPIK